MHLLRFLKLKPITKTKQQAILLAFIIFFTTNIFADDFRSDTSTAFLSVLFGHVSSSFSDVITGDTANPSLLGIVFNIFNGVVATIGSAIVLYIVVLSVMHSAHSGKPLGEKWSSLFLPVRVVGGAAMLLPNASGYCFAQVVTMWFILSGVTGADKVWDSVLSQLQLKGTRAVTGVPLEGKDVETLDDSAKGSVNFNGWDYLKPMMNFAGCVGSMGIPSPEIARTKDGAPIPTTTPACDYPPGVCDATQIPINIACTSPVCEQVVTVGTPSQEKCGSLTFGPLVSMSPTVKAKFVQRMIDDILVPHAEQVRGLLLTGKLKFDDGQTVYDLKTLDSAEYTDISQKFSASNPLPKFADIVNKSIAEEIAAQAKAKVNPINLKIGWIGAGATYYSAIKSGGTVNVNTKVSDFIGSPQNVAARPSRVNNMFISVIDQIPKVNSSAASPLGADVNAQFDVSYNNPLLTIIGLGVPLLIELVITEVLDTSELLGYPSNLDLTNAADIRKALNTDPLAKVAKAGAKITGTVETMIFGFMTAFILAVGIAVILPSLPYFYAVPAVITLGLTAFGLAIGVALVFYPIGMIMNVYVPLIPFLIYTSGVVGWMLLCVEAMAAAPIVALGLMHPNGADEMLGSAEAGLKLLINLMLRPALMVAGLVAGIISVRISLLYFNVFIKMLVDVKYVPITSLGAVGAVTMIYIGLISIIAHKCFGLINEIPNKVMTWIGASGSSVGGEQEFLQDAKGGTERGGKLAADTAAGAKSGAQMGKSAGSYASSFYGKKPAGGPSDAELGAG